MARIGRFNLSNSIRNANSCKDVNLASLTIRMSRSENLPAIPQALSEVMRLAESGETSPRTFEKALEREPGITTKIIKVANSPFYGAGKVQSVGRAVQILGTQTLRSVVTSMVMQSLVSQRTMVHSFDRIDYWRHCLATAVCCRIIGRLKMPGQAEELYCAGMMHDVGIMIMERFLPGDLESALFEANRRHVPLHYIERERLGYDHAEVGAILAEKWAFSQITRNAIRYHHDPTSDEETFMSTAVVALSNQVSHACGFRNNQDEDVQKIDAYLMHKLEIGEENMEVIRMVVIQEVERAAEALMIAA